MSQVLTKQDAEGLHTYLCVRTSIAFYSRGKEAQQTFASRQFGEASGYVTPLQHMRAVFICVRDGVQINLQGLGSEMKDL